MNITKAIETAFKKLLPSPFTIAILLTLVTIILAYFFTDTSDDSNHFIAILGYWETGIWNSKLLVFAYQMMLILVLGHVLVLSAPVSWSISRLTNLVTSNTRAVVLVSFCTMIVAFFNWGLGLIFGAILARKVGEHGLKNNIPLNYPLIGAAGYVGLMVWHGGMSGSAPLDAADETKKLSSMLGSEAKLVENLPVFVPTSDTIFSWWNLLIFITVLCVIPAVLYLIAKRGKTKTYSLPTYQYDEEQDDFKGADRLDHSKILAYLFGGLAMLVFCLKYGHQVMQLNFTLNSLNFLLFTLAILLHGNFYRFLKATAEAIKGTTGILIQFPLYFGIMGIMTATGMVGQIADFFASIATETTMPVVTFFSAGLVNIFVPSGGGQWAIQGPIVLEAALKLNVPIPKAIMALAYGDQITNMLQPFWALPLLGITKLKAKEILPYTLILMLVGSVIYIAGLLLI